MPRNITHQEYPHPDVAGWEQDRQRRNWRVAGRSAVVASGHERSIEPEVSGHMAPTAILDVEGVRP
jgi:hypothetical protein